MGDLILMILAIISGGFAFFIKRLYSRLDRMETDIEDYKERATDTYSLKVDCRQDVVDIKMFLSEVLVPLNKNSDITNTKLQSIEEHLRERRSAPRHN